MKTKGALPGFATASIFLGCKLCHSGFRGIALSVQNFNT